MVGLRQVSGAAPTPNCLDSYGRQRRGLLCGLGWAGVVAPKSG